MSEAEDSDVIVIGAGCSGLACAKALHMEGVDALVLEGRDRMGGRVASSHSPLPFQSIGGGCSVSRNSGPPHNFEYGAEWVHGTLDNPALEHIRAGGGEVEEIFPENPWMKPSFGPSQMKVYAGGVIANPNAVSRALKQYNLLMYACECLCMAAFRTGEGIQLNHIAFKDALEVIRRESDSLPGLALPKVKDMRLVSFSEQ